MLPNGDNDENDKNDKNDDNKKDNNKNNDRKTTNQMQNEVNRKQAPKDIKRVDKGNPDNNELDHVHLKDGKALNKDRTWKHNSSGSNDILSAVKNG